MDATVRRALAAIAGELQTTMASVPGWAAAEGAAGVRASDLQRAVCDALQAQLGSVACVDGPLPAGAKECWAGWLGRTDVLARIGEDSESYFETQLCGVDKLHESLWDALKLALFTALDEHRSGYLLYAAPETGWAREAHHPEAVFAGGTHWLAELLHDRYRELWGWCLSGTRTTRPISLPCELRSWPIASATIRAPATDWELRCVRVEGDAAAGWLRFNGDGWPLVEEDEEVAELAELEGAGEEEVDLAASAEAREHA